MYRQFKDFLIKQGVLEQYTRNLRKQRKPGETWIFDDANRIISTFDWKYTQKGEKWMFWNRIHLLWQTEYKKLHGQVHN